MVDVYNTLRSLKYFVDNEYLQKYAQLVERHTRTGVVPRLTHKHHIVPKSWFKLNNVAVNNDLNNLVNLPFREHMLAHYYLCLCTEDPFRYANQLALICLQRKKSNHVDKQLLHSLPLYNNIYEDYIIKLQSRYDLYNEVKNHDNKSDC